MMLCRMSLFAAVAVVAAGCGKGEYETASVSGRVTLNGQPVAKVAVMFQPIAPEGNLNPGPGSYGVTDSDGRYTLKLIGKETSGAVVGKHKVRIEVYTDPGDSSDDRPRKWVKPAVQIPTKYNQDKAILEFEVPASGTDEANFDLKSP
ncbi:MAG TPA: carboxypeptidase-like regulatory domain-containing protein [Gemmataceae bacterium]|nr:carboxypeptidase-like regulatory domain-containing protein [Gemmataceae bacterium]